MANFQITFFSATLGMQTDFVAFVPERPAKTPLKVVYLLHGMSDNQTNWSRFSSIELYCRSNNFAVIMPTTGLGWYTDMDCGYQKYFTYVSEEIPEIVHNLFPQISQKREDNFIAGLSMGGYGALKIALAKNDKFAKVATYSGAFNYFSERPYEPYWNSIFGDTPEKRQKHDVVTYMNALVENGGQKPDVFIWCGTSDDLLQCNRDMAKKLTDNGFNVTYSESEGGHEWRCWHEQFVKSIEYFGL